MTGENRTPVGRTDFKSGERREAPLAGPTPASPAATFRLTSLAHGGGCGCKLSPAVLTEILAKTAIPPRFANLLVGTETADDAAVYRINDTQAVIATTDFFTPVVDDPFDFGRIAATNALSDVYAMGGTPILALAILGIPVDKIPIEMVRQILAGGESVCTAASVPVAGGHSIDSAEPIYGLAVVGLVDSRRVLRNSGAQPRDQLILAKRLGIGIFSAALKRGDLDAADYSDMIASTTQLNRVGAEFPEFPGIHALTDVTGFGLLGHALEMCRGAGLSLDIRWGGLPIFPAAAHLAEAGVGTGASQRNWASYGANITLPTGMPEWQRTLLCDPQTSGGLLIACASHESAAILDLLNRRGFTHAAVIGEFRAGPAHINVL
jgi:selenide,water dikinase